MKRLFIVIAAMMLSWSAGAFERPKKPTTLDEILYSDNKYERESAIYCAMLYANHYGLGAEAVINYTACFLVVFMDAYKLFNGMKIPLEIEQNIIEGVMDEAEQCCKDGSYD